MTYDEWKEWSARLERARFAAAACDDCRAGGQHDSNPPIMLKACAEHRDASVDELQRLHAAWREEWGWHEVNGVLVPGVACSG